MLEGASMDWPEKGPEVVPHKTFYFPDGDVALQSSAIPTVGESYVFRIHVSVVALRSRYFASKLRSTPGSTLCEEYDGVPLVTLPDAPEELEGMYLHDCSCFASLPIEFLMLPVLN